MEYRIPLTPAPQSFCIHLAGRELKLTVRWSETDEGGWLLDIKEPDDAAPILTGIPLVMGCDLLEPYAYVGLGGSLVCYSEETELAPGIGSLGDGHDLYFVTHEDGEA